MVDWLQEIRTARSEPELVALCREYLAGWYHGDLAEIAEECRPTRVRDADDILYWNARLAEGFCAKAVHAEKPDRHREMLAFFMEAARRVDELPAPASAARPARAPSR
ncbi:MAG TPA: hypothetical protein VLY46_06085 [Usitatibacter sp.]|nr:hypothetical protein [Usitatibacter sp.]